MSHGHVNGIELIPVVNLANLTLERGTVVDINDIHRSMGNVHEDHSARWLIIMV
jgi:hypothetical protein